MAMVTTAFDLQARTPEFMRQQAQFRRELKEREEAERRERVDEARKTAQGLGQKLQDLRREKFSGEHADMNPHFVADPEIDVIEIRYREAVRVLEALDRE